MTASSDSAAADSSNGNLLATVEPGAIRRIHLIGVAGTGMGSFAGMLKAAGYEVTGSDENVYPPMSDMLQAWGIPAMTPYAAANLDAARADLVIVGNVIRRVNPEATAVRARGLAHMSFPAALGALFLASRHSLVVAGTHGKTTTSSLLGHVLVEAGLDPSLLVGGVTQNYAGNYRLGRGPHFVVEGDEYDTAYFDKGPKFLHYRARTLVLTSVELDHSDIYRDLPHYEAAFERLMAQLAPEALVAVSASWPGALRIARGGRGRVVSYSARPGVDADVTASAVSLGPEGARFAIRDLAFEGGASGVDVWTLPLAGLHNVENALGAYVAARGAGVSAAAIARGFTTFAGVRRRQEVRGEPGGVLVVDDFAHHPTAVRETIAAVAARYPGRRLWAVFEPRSNTSRRNIHQREYAVAFEGAGRVTIRVPERTDRVPAGEQLDVGRIAAELRGRGVAAAALGAIDDIVAELEAGTRAGDVVLVMSNGAFGGLMPRLLERLGKRGA